MQGRATPLSPSNADYDALFELTATPTLEVDINGVLLRTNAAAARLLHTGLGKTQDQTLSDIFGESALAVLTVAGPHDVEADIQGDGVTALRLWSVARDLAGAHGERFTVQVVRREGREAIDADRRAEASRLSLLDDVSHNLGTPLAIVAGYAETLAERWQDLDAEDIATATAAIHRHAHRAVNELRALQARVRVNGNGIGTIPTAVLVAWLRRMLSGPLAANGTVLLDNLQRAAHRRNILAWSADPVIQAGWEAIGVDGEMAPESVMVSMLNRGGNKLDFFLRMEGGLDFTRDNEGELHGTLTVQVRNFLPDGESGYVAGPFPDIDITEDYGDYNGIVSITLPGFARNAQFTDDDADVVVAGADGPTVTVAARIFLKRGETATYTVTFDLPGELDAIRLEPSGRVRPFKWRVGQRLFEDDEAHRVRIFA